MKLLVAFAAAFLSAQAAIAEDLQPSGPLDRFKNLLGGVASELGASQWWSLPSLPNWSLGAGIGDDVAQQINGAIPVVGKMGFEVSTLSIEVGFPPQAHLRLRSTTVTDLKTVLEAAANGATGVVSSFVINSAVSAKRIQLAMNLDTIILDVDIAVPPKVRMTFMGTNHDPNETSERIKEDMDVSSAKAVEH